MKIDYLLRFLNSSNDDGSIKYFLKEHTLGSSSLKWLYTKSLSDVTSVKTEFEQLVNRSEHKILQYKYALLLEKQQNIDKCTLWVVGNHNNSVHSNVKTVQWTKNSVTMRCSVFLQTTPQFIKSRKAQPYVTSRHPF